MVHHATCARGTCMRPCTRLCRSSRLPDVRWFLQFIGGPAPERRCIGAFLLGACVAEERLHRGRRVLMLSVESQANLLHGDLLHSGAARASGSAK